MNTKTNATLAAEIASTAAAAAENMEAQVRIAYDRALVDLDADHPDLEILAGRVHRTTTYARKARQCANAAAQNAAAIGDPDTVGARDYLICSQDFADAAGKYSRWAARSAVGLRAQPGVPAG